MEYDRRDRAADETAVPRRILILQVENNVHASLDHFEFPAMLEWTSAYLPKDKFQRKHAKENRYMGSICSSVCMRAATQAIKNSNHPSPAPLTAGNREPDHTSPLPEYATINGATSHPSSCPFQIPDNRPRPPRGTLYIWFSLHPTLDNDPLSTHVPVPRRHTCKALPANDRQSEKTRNANRQNWLTLPITPSIVICPSSRTWYKPADPGLGWTVDSFSTSAIRRQVVYSPLTLNTFPVFTKMASKDVLI